MLQKCLPAGCALEKPVYLISEATPPSAKTPPQAAFLPAQEQLGLACAGPGGEAHSCRAFRNPGPEEWARGQKAGPASGVSWASPVLPASALSEIECRFYSWQGWSLGALLTQEAVETAR
ncbi:hypothetical protein P7K49_006036 [Saguinus oedipus]|uniref:Uncharacterized protein n=1 Tax=Saguinus oedipus TaxID=9490 RepID=A0ABQ9W217_SAGOE|nr:hypothetical protein P7K49_006036 [Saguinus oedipus]